MPNEETYPTKPLDAAEVIATVERAVKAKGPNVDGQVPDDVLGIIVALAIAIDAKDPCTRGHSVWVAKYAAATAEALGLKPKEIENVVYASLLHDIGKIGISEKILHKPDVLNVEEWEEIRAHPVIGAKILEPIPSLHELVPLVKYHHERYDGTGYPEGLAGERIPFGARILAVADAFEAMTSGRPYSQTRYPVQALDILIEGMGKQWDAKMVEAFVNVLDGEQLHPIAPLIIGDPEILRLKFPPELDKTSKFMI